MKRILTILSTLLVLLLACARPGLRDGTYRVYRVIDGDTLILHDVGRVRMADVNAPELDIPPASGSCPTKPTSPRGARTPAGGRLAPRLRTPSSTSASVQPSLSNCVAPAAGPATSAVRTPPARSIRQDGGRWQGSLLRRQHRLPLAERHHRHHRGSRHLLREPVGAVLRGHLTEAHSPPMRDALSK